MKRLIDLFAGAIALWLALWRLVGDANGWLALANAWAFWLLLKGIPLGTVALWRRSRALAVLWAVGAGTMFVQRYGPLLRRIFAPTPAQPIAGDKLRVVSSNLLNEARNLDETAQAILALDADVVLFQECIQSHCEQLEPSLREAYPHRAWVPYLPSNMGLGVVSRIPFAVTGIWQDIGLEPYALRLAMALPNGPLDVYCIHFISPNHQIRRFGPTRLLRTREQQIRTVLQEIQRHPRPAIVAGDWNSTEGADSYRRTAAQLVDGWIEGGVGAGWTWQRLLFGQDVPPLLRLDYLFHTGRSRSRPVQVTKMRSVVDPQVGSDHCPIVADLIVASASRSAEISTESE
ncbi:MAG: endonuclease/exonuclease/phosphatase family protein [Caldilineaceae bacterium]|nr:endonuclease/exonuclease/phosphatase family protein [Caldilineaceae bacterium]